MANESGLKETIETFWRLFNEREFDEAKGLLHEGFSASWKATGEKFKNREDFIAVNRDYPGNWKAVLEKLETTETGAVSITYLYFEDKEDKFYATTFYEFKDDLIYRIEEYWATCEKAPNWREDFSE